MALDRHFSCSLNGILMGFEKVHKKGKANLISDTPFLHVDVVGTFFVLRPVAGETLEVIVIKKGVGHLDALLHDVFSVFQCLLLVYVNPFSSNP